MKSSVIIIGGGLAGCECALTLAKFKIPVTLYEQKPYKFSPAHTSEHLGELVCSNSFRSNSDTGPQSSGVGILKQEMRKLDGFLIDYAEKYKVPAGKALAVDRELFSNELTKLIENNQFINLVRQEIKSIVEIEEIARQNEAAYIVIASGPLTSEDLTNSLAKIVGDDYCYFYDAIAPIISADSLDNEIIFKASRYDNVAPPGYSDEVANSPELSKFWQEKMQEKILSEQCEKVDLQSELEADQGDYLNCPMHKFEYERFYTALLEAEKVETHQFEKEVHFEGCMPIEALADRGEKTLTFGPLKPVGFTDPRTGRRPYAILQLRTENNNADAYNLVGCQTKMTYKAQDQVFRLIPGLEKVEFLRYGSMHRNTYVNAPICLNENLAIKGHEHIFLAGQITGVEGYVESIAIGLWLGIYLTSVLLNKEIQAPPNTTALGALLSHLKNTKTKNFQPSNINFGLMPELAEKTKKKNRKEQFAERACQDFDNWHNSLWIKE